MTSRSVLGSLAVAALAACGGHGTGTMPGSVAPAASAEGAVKEFMAGVADSNLGRIGSAWGTSKGTAAATNQPADWQRRVTVMQLWLRGGTYQVTGNQQLGADQHRRQITIELTRGTCVKTIPFVVVETKPAGWVVEQVDVTTAGNPRQPCSGTTQTGNQ